MPKAGWEQVSPPYLRRGVGVVLPLLLKERIEVRITTYII